MTLIRRAVLAGVLLLPLPAAAQRSVRVRADNDAFNFWQAPWNRPDEEYTSGVRVELVYDGASALSRRLFGTRACYDPSDRCAERAFSFGQDIYTAVRTREHPVPAAGARPDAGVLWFSGVERLRGPARTDEFRWTIGLTGTPALAEPMQRFFHGLAPGWNRPVDWSRQLPAEPVLALAYDQSRVRRTGALEWEPHGGVSLGNLLTEARGGVGFSLGPDAWGARGVMPALAIVGDATLRAVARNEVLSGTMLRSSESVPLRRLVPEAQVGARARWRALGVTFAMHRTAHEYQARRTAHVWSTLQAEWWPAGARLRR